MSLLHSEKDPDVIIRVTSNDKLWKMDTNDPQIVKKHHKDLEHLQRALLANEANIFRPIEKKLSQAHDYYRQSKPVTKARTDTQVTSPKNYGLKKASFSKRPTIAPEIHFDQVDEQASANKDNNA